MKYSPYLILLGITILIGILAYFLIESKEKRFLIEKEKISKRLEDCNYELQLYKNTNNLLLDSINRVSRNYDIVIKELSKSSEKLKIIYENFKKIKPNYNDSILLESLRRTSQYPIDR